MLSVFLLRDCPFDIFVVAIVVVVVVVVYSHFPIVHANRFM